MLRFNLMDHFVWELLPSIHTPQQVHLQLTKLTAYESAVLAIKPLFKTQLTKKLH